MNPYYMCQQFTDAKQLEALSDEQLEGSLTAWQHALAHFQGCVVDIVMDLCRLQQEQARREHLRETCGPKAGETPQSEQTTPERVLSIVPRPRSEEKLAPRLAHERPVH